jgi:hypothetical protein
MGSIRRTSSRYLPNKLSFFEVKSIVKKYGYKSGDLLYYLVPGSSLQKGLRLITSDHDMFEMVNVHKGAPIVELYIVSFGEPIANDNDYEYDDGGQSRIDWDDPYWDPVYESNLFDENNDVAGPFMEEDMEEGDEVRQEGSEESEGDEKYVKGGEESREEIGLDNDSEEGVRSRGNCVDSEAEDDDVNSDKAQSDILISPHNIDEEANVAS